MVSRRHAFLGRGEGRWWLEDRGSRNGTYVNGRRLTGATEVRPGDEIALGDIRFVLVAPAE
jgi:pSer/pThr/pTyr-binding forkhead associated (FHA) protein